MDADDHPFLSNQQSPRDHANEWQAWVLIFGIAELFLFFLVFSTTWGERRMISDNLLHPSMGLYTGAMTFFVIFQCAVCAGYLNRFRKRDLAYSVVGWGFVLVTLVGWVVLAYNADTVTHYAGVGLYLTGLGGTYIVLLRLSKQYDAKLEGETYDLVAGILLVSTVGFLVSFLVLFFLDDEQAWLWENIAFLCYLIFYIYFFSSHPHDPTISLTNARPFADTPVCRPLIIIKRT